MKGPRQFASALALAALVALVAGCGGGAAGGSGAGQPAAGQSGGSSASSSSGSSGASKGTIVVGAIAGTTGAYGTTGIAMVNGAKMAVQDINAKGGVLGKKLSLQWYNDQASSTLSSQLFQRLVSAGAVAITGSGDTGPATAAMAQRLHIPNIGVVDDAGITVYPNGPDKPPLSWVFDFGLNTFAWGGIDASYALSHCKGLAVLHDPASYGEGGNAAITSAYAKAGKKLALDDTISEDWSSGATVGLTSEINKIKSSGADCVVVWLTPQDTARFAQTLQSTGTKLTILGNDEINADNTFASLAGNAANGAIGAFLSTEVHPSSTLLAWRKRYQSEFGVASTPFAETTYDSVMMLAQAIKNAGSTKPAAIQNALNHISGFQGLTGTLSFSPMKHATIEQAQLSLVKYDAATKQWVPLQ
jgi:branched-chain amino acid transport system substrate-binding protein